MATVKSLLRAGRGLALGVLYRTGLLSWYARRLLRDKIVVLTYHRVLPRERQLESFSAASIVVTPATFDRHMAWIRRNWRPVSVEELRELLNGAAPIIAGTCVVTFDDGWYDNLEHALPILEKYQIPATIFLATDYIGSTDCFWQESVSRLLYLLYKQGARSAATLHAAAAAHILELDDRTARRAIRELVAAWKAKTPAEIDAFMQMLADALPTGQAADLAAGSADRFLTWPEAAQLESSKLLTIGSHTMSHTPLTTQSADVRARELSGSREVIARLLSTTPDVLAYPHGACDEDVARAAREAGYAVAFTTRPGHVTRKSHPLQLERLNVHGGLAHIPALLGRVVGAL